MTELGTSSTTGPDADYYIGFHADGSGIVELETPIKLGTTLADEFRLWVTLGKGRPTWDTGYYTPKSSEQKDVVLWALIQNGYQQKFKFTGAIIFELNAYKNTKEVRYPLAKKFESGVLFPPEEFARLEQQARTRYNAPQSHYS